MTVFLFRLREHVHTHIFRNLSVLSCLGSKSQKHVLRPEALEGTDEEDPVSALEWDLLSTDYLLGWTNYLSFESIDAINVTLFITHSPEHTDISQPLPVIISSMYMFVNGYHVKISQMRCETILSMSKVRAQTQQFPNCPEIPL